MAFQNVSVVVDQIVLLMESESHRRIKPSCVLNSRHCLSHTGFYLPVWAANLVRRPSKKIGMEVNLTGRNNLVREKDLLS